MRPLLLILTICLLPLAATAEKRPNILFIIVDDLNDYLGSFGGHPQAHTPNIDRLAKMGAQFTNAHTNVPVCAPSRSSLFTGIYPHSSRDFGWTKLREQYVLKHNKTFLELLSENGYKLYGTGKILHNNIRKLWHEWGVTERINYGPHAFNGNRITPHPNVPEPFRSINIVDGSFAPLSDVPQFPKGRKTKHKPGWGYPIGSFRYVSETDRDLLPDEQHAVWAKKKLTELAQNKSNHPFFMGIGFVRPHTPLYAPKRFFDMFPLDEIELPKIKKNDSNDTAFTDNYPMTQMGLHYYQALMDSYEDDEEGLKKVVQAYLACIAFMDEQLGIVLDALENTPLKDNTIIIFTSDHGWQFGEKNYLYKNSPWEESTRIPLLITAPHLTKPGMKIENPVSLIDIFPTIWELAELKGSYKMDKKAATIGGASLVPLLTPSLWDRWKGAKGALTVMGAGIDKPIKGLALTTNPHALWHVKIIKDLPLSYVWQQTYSYRTKNWRYIRYKDGQEELYHNRTDPYEWHNLAQDKKYTRQKNKLKKQMVKLIGVPLPKQ